MGLDRALAKIASGQRMLLTRDDVAAAGGTRSHIHRRVASGRWEQVLPGVYLIAGAPRDWATMQLALTLASGPGAVASHLAAARLWDIPGYARARTSIAVAPSSAKGYRSPTPDGRSSTLPASWVRPGSTGPSRAYGDETSSHGPA